MVKDELLSPAEVARLFRVNPKTVTRWARSGKINAIRTLGGHRATTGRRSSVRPQLSPPTIATASTTANQAPPVSASRQ